MDLDHIVEDLRPLARPITDLVPDPENARAHDEKNLEAIRQSLTGFQQRKNIVVQRRSTGEKIVRAGNGTLQAALALGWTHVAAVIIDEDDDKAEAFAIADNRTNDLSSFDNTVLTSILTRQDNPAALGFTQEDMMTILSPELPTRKQRRSKLTSEIEQLKPEAVAELEKLSGYRTSPDRKKPSDPLRNYIERGYMKGPDILDYGCGRDHHNFARYDPAYFSDDMSVFDKRYDTVMNNYVLNVLPLVGIRVAVVLAIRGLVKPDGQALISVLREGGIQTAWRSDTWQAFLEDLWPNVERLKVVGGFWAWRCTL